MQTIGLQTLNCNGKPSEQQALLKSSNQVDRIPSTTPDSTISPRTPTSSVMLADYTNDDLVACAPDLKDNADFQDASLSKHLQFTENFDDQTKVISVADELGQTRHGMAAKRSIQLHRTDERQRLSLTAKDTYAVERFQIHNNDQRGYRSCMNLPFIYEQPPSSPTSPIEYPQNQFLHDNHGSATVPIHHSHSRNDIHVSLAAPISTRSCESLLEPSVDQPSRIPLLQTKRIAKKRNVIIKKGFLLCAMKMSWYRSEQNLTGELASSVSLRQNRPRWREFEAVLYYDRLELYAITDVVFRPRVLTHVIYLLPGIKHGVNTARLSLTSSVDYTWRLQFRTAEEARVLSFMFSARTISQSQAWYMALYRLSTAKLPVPPSIDICVPTLNNIHIRIPIGSDIVANNNNIRLADVKESILRMLDQQKIRPLDWFEDRVGLCWRTVSNPPRLEWITDPSATFLVGPQIIEQTHQLELLPYKNPDQGELPSPIMEGDLVIWTFPKKDPFGKPPKVRRQIHLIIDGSLLILLDISRAEKPHCTDETTLDNRARLTSVGFSRYSKFSFRSNAGGVTIKSVARLLRNGSGSSSVALKKEQDAKALLEAELSRQARNLNAAFAIMDLAQATLVRPAREDTYGTVKAGPELRRRSFELHINNQVLLFETESVQIAFDWIMRIRRAIQACQRQATSGLDLEKNTRLGYRLQRAEWQRSILQFGTLYVRNNRQKTYRHRFCVLTVNKCLIIFKMWQRKYWTNEAMSSTMYNYHKTIPLDAAYVYSDEHSQTHRIPAKEPPKMFADGTVSSDGPGSNTFVIWRPKVLHPFIKPFTALKIGHRTGRKGTLWTFLARDRQEKETWLWALHQEIDTVI